MPSYDYKNDPAFLKASPDDQRSYLTTIDPNFAKAARPDQDAYLSHISGLSVAPTAAPGGSPAVGTPAAQPQQSKAIPTNTPPTPGLLSRAWSAANDPSYAANFLGVGPEEQRLAKIRDQAIVAGNPTKAALAELQRGDIDPQEGYTRLLTPLTGAMTLAAPVTEALGAAGRVAEAGISTAFGAPAAKDVLRGQQPGESYVESLSRRGGDVGQMFLSALGLGGALAPRTAGIPHPTQAPQPPDAAFEARATVPQMADKPVQIALKPQAAGDPQPIPTTSPSTDLSSQSPVQSERRKMLGVSPTGVERRIPDLPSTLVQTNAQRVIADPRSDPRDIQIAKLQLDELKHEPMDVTAVTSDDISAARAQAAGTMSKEDALAADAKRRMALAPPIVGPQTEGLEGLTPEQQDRATEAINRLKSKQATTSSPEAVPFQKMVEDAGGRWRGMDSMGLAHYDAPPEMVGGRDSVSIASPVEKMSPEFVKGEFQRKATDFSVPSQPSLRESQANVPQPNQSQQATRIPETLDLLPQLKQSFNRITQYSSDITNAKNDADRSQARFQRAQEIKQSGAMVRDLVGKLPPDQLPILRDYVNKIADENGKRADFIDGAVKAHNQGAQARQEMTAMRAVGYTEQAKGAEAGELEGLSVERQAETAPLSRSIMDRLQGKQPRVTLDNLVVRKTPPGMDDDQWGEFSSKLKQRIQNDHDSILRDAQIAIDTNGSIEDSDLPGRMKELDRDVRMLGKFPAAPASPGARPSMRIEGREAAPAEVITQAKASQMLGRKVRKIPDMNEFTQKANELRELANLHKSIGKAIDSQIGLKPVPRAAERGAVGEMLAPTITDREAVSPEKMMAAAKKSGFRTWNVTDTKAAGTGGLLSKDGKTFISLGPTNPSHSATAEALLPALRSTLHDVALNAMLEHGWIRKVTNNEYESHVLDSKNIDTIETDMIRNGSHGQSTSIDTKDATGRIRALRIDPGWEDLSSEINREKSRIRFPEAGKVSGTEIMAGMAGGMAVGMHVGGPAGAVVGGVLGATTPALLRSPIVANAFRYTRGLRNPLGVSVMDWFRAPQDSPAISPEMASIRQTQLQSLKAPERQLAYRQSLAGDIWKKLDPFAFVTDRPNPVQQWTMKEDPRGKGFRDAKGQFNLDESPYVAVRSAVSGIRGAVGVARQMMSGIETDARNNGLHGETTDYLNLKAYQRAYDVVNEHMQALSSETQGLKQQLAVEDDVVKQVGLYKRIEANTDALKEMGDNYRSGKLAPGGYDPPKIQRDLQALQQKLTPDQFGKVQDYAKRVFDVNRQTLDLIADTKNNFKNGIISKDLYNQFTARGDEYIPMKRIMENLADPNGKFFGKSSPLYLRQQNVIRQLEGSERVNVDPWQASSDANAEAIREHYRNRTLGTILDAAHQSPAIAQYFKAVPESYKAGKGESIVGLYREGEQQRYAVPQWLGESLDTTSLNQTQSTLNIVNRAITSVFKSAATVFNPAWVIARQLPTVAGRALLTAEGPKDPAMIASAFRDAVVSAWTHDDKWMDAAKTGLMRNKLLSLVYPEAKLDTAALGKAGPLGRLPLHPLETVRALAELPSDVLQLNHWNRLRQAGYSPEAATFKTQTRGPLPDYAQIGKLDGPIGLATTFLRAEWAHIRSDLALATDKEYQGRLALAGLAVAIPTLALVMHNLQQTDEKGNPLWSRVSNSDKEKFWTILTGGTNDDGSPKAIKIGKPDFVSTYFNPMEDAMYKGMQNAAKPADTRSIGQLIANTASRFIPGHPQFDAQAFQGARATTEELARKTGSSLYQQITPAARVPIEQKFNATDQFGRIVPIVPQNEEKISPSLQGFGDPHISSMSMDIGRTLGISPRKIEHAARGFLGPGAATIEGIGDPLLKGQFPQSQGSKITTSSPTRASSINQSEIDAQNKFYSTVQQVAEPYNNYLKMKSVDSVAAQKYMNANPDAVWKGQIANNLVKRLSEITQRQHQIDSIPMDPRDKAALTQNLHDVKMNLMGVFQDMLDNRLKQPLNDGGHGNALSQGTKP